MIVAESTELFVGPRTALLQVVQVTVQDVPGQDVPGPVHAHVSGPGLHSARHGGALPLGPFGFEVGVDVSEHSPGDVVPAVAVVRWGSEESSCAFPLVVGSPGWTMHLVGQVSGDAPFDVLRAHLDLALTDPSYRFAVTSVELLQPYWDTFPQHRSLLLRLIAEGRVEAVGDPSNVVGVEPLLSSLPSGCALAASSLGEAERVAYTSFLRLRNGASSPHVMLPVGSPRSAPNRWVTAIHHDWNSRYTWPRFVCSLPRDYHVRGSVPVPAVVEDDSLVSRASALAFQAARLTGAVYPSAALTRARSAHPREAFDLCAEVTRRSLAALTSTVDSSVVVWNPLSVPCTDVVTVPVGRNVHVSDGSALPTLVDGTMVTFLARDVPALGWRTFSLVEDNVDHGWKRGYGTEIASTHFTLSCDPVASLVAVDGPVLEPPALEGPVTVWHSEVGEKMVGSTSYVLWNEVAHLSPSPLVGVLGSRSPASGSLPVVPSRLTAVGPPLGPVEPDSPVFARYWLHGPAPLGGLSANVHLEVLSPTRLRVVAVSDGDAFSGFVRLTLPDGWSASWTTLPVSVSAGGYTSAEVRLRRSLTPGCYPVRASLVGLPVVVEDVVLLSVPEWDFEDPVEVLWVFDAPSVVRVSPGSSAPLRVSVASGAHGSLPVRAWILSPRPTWELVGPFSVSGEVPAQGHVSVEFTVAAPEWAAAGAWSAVVKVAAGELIRHSPVIRIEVVSMGDRD